MITGLLLLYIFFLLFFYKKNNKNFRPITVFGYTILIYVLYIFCITEILSLFHLISSISIIICWMLFDGVLLYKNISFRKNNKTITNNLIKETKKFINKNKIYVFILFVFVFIVLLISLLIIPFNWDSLCYHLTRLVVWLSQGSVEHFSTIDTRMLGTPPLKEFVDLNIYAIIGHVKDSFLNLTQTFSYLFNALFVVEIASLIGCKKRGKILSAMIYASSPICLGEAFSTQTDQFAALFVLIFIILCSDLIRNIKLINLEKDGLFRMVLIGICVALTYLAKPSGIFAILVFALYISISCIKNKITFKTIIIWILVVGLVALFILFPELLRNYITYGSVMDPWQGPGQLVLTLDPRYLIVNMIKNYGTNVVGFIFPSLANYFPRIVYSTAKLFGIDAASELIAERGRSYILFSNNRYNFDTAGNYLIFLILPLIILIFVIKSIKKRQLNCPYGIPAFISLLIALCFIKWEPYMTRYLIAYIGVITPFIAYEIDNISHNKYVCIYSFMFISTACFILLFFGLKDYINRTYILNSYKFNTQEQAYYVENPIEYYDIYEPLKEKLKDKHYKNIGLDIYSSGSFHYPIFKLLLEHADNVSIIHSRNKTSKYENKNYNPEVIVETCYSTICPNDFDSYEYQEKKYNNIEKISNNVWIIQKD